LFDVRTGLAQARGGAQVAGRAQADGCGADIQDTGSRCALQPDDQIEYQVRDRLSFMRFLGLGLEGRAPDAKTVWLYRERLAQAGMLKALFQKFDGSLAQQDHIARGRQTLDCEWRSATGSSAALNELPKLKRLLADTVLEWALSRRRRSRSNRWCPDRQLQATMANSGLQGLWQKMPNACCPIAPNQWCSVDFTGDALANRRRFRPAKLKEDCTGERPAIERPYARCHPCTFDPRNRSCVAFFTVAATTSLLLKSFGVRRIKGLLLCCFSVLTSLPCAKGAVNGRKASSKKLTRKIGQRKLRRVS
jgi:hypothetical protein